MIAPDGRKVPVVLLTPEMIRQLAERWENHPDPSHLHAVAVDGRVFFARFEDTITSERRKLIRRNPELILPEDSGYRMETSELIPD